MEFAEKDLEEVTCEMRGTFKRAAFSVKDEQRRVPPFISIVGKETDNASFTGFRMYGNGKDTFEVGVDMLNINEARAFYDFVVSRTLRPDTDYETAVEAGFFVIGWCSKDDVAAMLTWYEDNIGPLQRMPFNPAA